MKLNVVTLNDFSVGFDASCVEDTMSMGSTPNSYNVLALDGSLKTMEGYFKYIDQPISYNGNIYVPRYIMPYYKEEGQQTLLVIASYGSSTSLFQYDSSGGSWSNLGSNFADDDYGWINYRYGGQDVLLFCNPVNGLYQYTSNGSVSLVSWEAPGGSSLAVHYERLWIAGDAENPYAVFFSDENDPSIWSDEEEGNAGEISILTQDGEPITCICNIYDDVVVFKKSSIYRISGANPSQYQVRQVYAPNGAVSRKGIAVCGRNAYFVGVDGIYEYDGIKAQIVEDDKLRYFFENRVNRDALSACAAVSQNNRLYVALAIDGSTKNNAVLEYDITRGIFHLKKDICVLDFAVFENKIIFSDDSGYIYEYAGATDFNGLPIAAHYETPYSDLGNKLQWKGFDSICFTGRGQGTVKLTLETERGSRSKLIALKSSDVYNVYTVPLHLEGVRFKLHIDNENGSCFEIANVELHYEQDEE